MGINRDRILLTVAIAAASLINISIAASQTMLGVGILLLLVFRQKVQFPRIWIPLAFFFFWTALADVLSPDPWGGRAQIRKFFIFFFIPLIYGVFVAQFEKLYLLVVAWTATATASGLAGLVQYVIKYEHARQTGANFYVTYLARRITGFQGHWMMFGALQLGALSLVLAHNFFSARKMPRWAYASVVIFLAAILLAWDRGIWIATVPVVIYLIWFWRPRFVLIVPLAIALAFVVSPASTRSRMQSLLTPHGDTDSNRFRVVTFRTGVQMVKAHPWFGLGPGQIPRQFDAYVPADIQRPLPPGYYGHLHNFYVQYAAESGIPALLFVLWFIALAWRDCIRGILRARHTNSDQLFVLHATSAVIIGILVGGLFEHNLGDSEVLMMFVCVFALSYAAIENLDTRPKLSRRQPPARSPLESPVASAPEHSPDYSHSPSPRASAAPGDASAPASFRMRIR